MGAQIIRSRRAIAFRLALALALLGAIAYLAIAAERTPLVRGKSSALPLADSLTPEQQQAQELALADGRVQQLNAGRRAEVFGVRQVLANQFTAASAACAQVDCRQVEFYLFDENAAVLAIVDVDNGRVLDVLYQPGVHPGISRAQSDRAIQLAREAPQVIEALGYRPLQVSMAPVHADMPGTSCDGDHYCVGPSFQLGNRAFWTIVDLTEGRLAGAFWGEAMPDPAREPRPSTPSGCPQPGALDRDGWQLSYGTTGSDGLHVYDVSFEGSQALKSVKTIQWHVHYGKHFGFRDELGCGASGGGYLIQPYGETQVVTLTAASGVPVGFELIQDFRMDQWGEKCNYRYENRLQFFSDGRFRIGNAAYGQGCQPHGLYKPVVRIDIAVDGNDGDTFAYLDETGWRDVATETYRTPHAKPDHGPHHVNAAGSSWSVFDEGGRGYFIVSDQGHYPASNGDDPFLYVTRHNGAEGDTDMGAIGSCCSDGARPGPEQYVDGENVSATDIVIWYVGQMQTDPGSEDSAPSCWTVAGEPDPETYPCISGPLFQPFSPDFIHYLPVALLGRAPQN